MGSNQQNSLQSLHAASNCTPPPPIQAISAVIELHLHPAKKIDFELKPKVTDTHIKKNTKKGKET